jgi:hypothetical protein
MFGARLADMLVMSEFAAWEIAGASILFLAGCAWNNRRTGYRRVASASEAFPAGLSEGTDSLPDASPVWNPASQPFQYARESAHSFSLQLITLQRVLGTEPVEVATRSVSVR